MGIKTRKEMAQEDLIPVTMRSKEEAKAISSRGGIASGEARRQKRTFRQIAEMLAERKIVVGTPDGKEDATFGVAVVLAQYQKAIKGDTRAAAYLTNLLGEEQLANVSNTTIVVKSADEADRISNIDKLGV